MKFIRNILPLAVMALSLAACDDNDPGSEAVITPMEKPACELADGSTVDILLQKSIELDFNHPITVADASGITLNGVPVKEYKVDVCKLTVPLRLEGATDYKFRIAPGALVRWGHSDQIVPEYNLSFSTRPIPVLDRKIVNPNITPEARKVFDMLADNYGKRCLTGCMGSEAWTTVYYDLVTEAGGAAPAIIGFDYMHLNASPCNWIDYNDITPVKEAWEAGAIPALMWHWNVPRTNKKGAKYDTAPSKFMPSNIFIPGSWEHDIAMADIEELAGYLKHIQDAGIPVLFRPFHEAAGDFGYNNPWFWWGAEGVEVTKQLWDMLYDKLTNEYGLNNILWVWTMQTRYNGALSPGQYMLESYPGDDKVDIVGVDLYPSENKLYSDFETWYAVREVLEGKKMIALSETGPLPDLDLVFDKGETWSFFMQWYDILEGSNNDFGFHKYSTPEDWQKTLASPYALNRDELKNLLK